MSHFNKHYKTQSELIELGFTQEQIDNAKLSNMNLDIDEKCFELFDISILFRLIDNRIYKCYFINYKGEKLLLVNGDRNGYNISTTYNYTLGFDHQKPSLYNDFDELAYKGDKAKKFNAKKLLEMAECAYNQQICYFNAYKKSLNMVDNIRELLVKNGFELYSDNRAYKKSKDKNISIEITYSDSGHISQKVTTYGVDFNNIDETNKRLEKLNALLD